MDICVDIFSFEKFKVTPCACLMLFSYRIIIISRFTKYTEPTIEAMLYNTIYMES